MPTATPSAGTTTSFDVTSQPGDWVGQGLTNHFVAPCDRFTLFSDSGGGFTYPATTAGFSMNVNAADGENWGIEVDPPRGQRLHTGIYSAARRSPAARSLATAAAGLLVFGDYRDCGKSFDSFNIQRLVTDSRGLILAIYVTFVQHCNLASAPPLTGRLEVNTTA